ncbi:MAG TPA: glycosyltransferase [Longimicrobium sp.]|jgi:GT2 family glycosyltransferase|uniref:glycosyltransferase n=1 Tax=Longimicrobium sp. TaxID=2029185 RepID=UPI002EDB2946
MSLAPGLRAAWLARAYRWDSLAPLLWEPSSGEGEGPWDEEVFVDGRSAFALFVPGGCTLSCRLEIPAGARLHALVRAGDAGGEAHSRGAAAWMEVRTVDDGVPLRRRWSLRLSGRGAWTRVFPALRRFAGREVEIVLSGPAGPSAVAVWAHPALAFALPRAELAQLARTYLRLFGGAGAIARLAGRLRSASSSPTGRANGGVDHPAPHPAAAGPPQEDAAGAPPVLSLLIVVPPDASAQAVRRTLESLQAQHAGGWEALLLSSGGAPAAAGPRVRILHPGTAGSVAEALNRGLEAARGTFVALIDPGDELAPGAVAAVRARGHRAVLVYTDEDRLREDGTRRAAFRKPAWSPDYLRSFPYVRRLCAIRTAEARALGGWRAGVEGAHEYDLLLRIAEGGGAVEHVPDVLYHTAPRRALGWRALALAQDAAGAARALDGHLARAFPGSRVESGAVPGVHRVRHPVGGEPLVSIVVPTAGLTRVVGGRTLDLLAHCVRSIAGLTAYPRWELVCVDNGDLRPETRAAVDAAAGARVRWISYAGPFNVAAKMNMGAAAAAGEHLVFLNDDTEVRSPDWMGALLELSARPDVGAVGAKLYFPGGRVQHAGVYLHRGDADHVYRAVLPEHPGRGFDLLSVRDWSAVTGACLMTRAGVFGELGGFDESYPVNFNDVDYCLRVREAGYRVLFTPHARLYHLESVSRTVRDEPAAAARLLDRWGTGDDPFYTNADE